MKIKGASSGLNTKEVLLPRDNGQHIILTVRALPRGFPDEVDRRLPDPVPPSGGIAIDPKTRKPILDESGRVRQVYNAHDKGFRDAARLNNYRQFALFLVEGFKGNPDVEFVSKRDQFETDAAYADAILQEVTAFGLSDGDLAALVDGIMEASNVDEERLEAVRATFLSEQARPPQSDPASTSPSSTDARPATSSGEPPNDSANGPGPSTS